MSNTNTGGPAFPVCDAARIHNLEGMTLRDYFAVKAMQGLMSTERAGEFVDDTGNTNWDEAGTLFVHTKFLAEEAYMIADNMLKARGV